MAATQSILLSSSKFQLLGPAPVHMQNLGAGQVAVVVSDTVPDAGSAGYILLPGQFYIFQPADAKSNVYATLPAQTIGSFPVGIGAIGAPTAAMLVYNVVSSQVG